MRASSRVTKFFLFCSRSVTRLYLFGVCHSGSASRSQERISPPRDGLIGAVCWRCSKASIRPRSLAGEALWRHLRMSTPGQATAKLDARNRSRFRGGDCWQSLGPQPQCQANRPVENSQIDPCSARRTNRVTMLRQP